MNKESFIQQRITGRRQLLANIIAAFTKLHPLAIHQFGSGANGFTDAFSDIDMWITFRDEDIDAILRTATSAFSEIAPVLLIHHSKTWSPVGGAAYSVLHLVDNDLFVVDYYLSKQSETILMSDASCIYGDDSLPRGRWKLNRHVNEQMKDTHTIKKDIDLLLDLLFISYKGIVRKWEDDSFVKTLRTVHTQFRERYPGKVPTRRITLSFTSHYRLLNDMYRVANKRQRRAINKIKKYAKHIEEMYFY